MSANRIQVTEKKIFYGFPIKNKIILMESKAWGDGLSHGYAGQPATFLLNPSGVSLTGITFEIIGNSSIEHITAKHFLHYISHPTHY